MTPIRIPLTPIRIHVHCSKIIVDDMPTSLTPLHAQALASELADLAMRVEYRREEVIGPRLVFQDGLRRDDTDNDR